MSVLCFLRLFYTHPDFCASLAELALCPKFGWLHNEPLAVRGKLELLRLCIGPNAYLEGLLAFIMNALHQIGLAGAQGGETECECTDSEVFIHVLPVSGWKVYR